jgi:hypothetical protein
MEHEIAEEYKAKRPASKSPLNPGFSSRAREHSIKTPFARYAQHKEAVQIKAAKLHIGMLRAAQVEESELDRVKKELEQYKQRAGEQQEVQTRQAIASMKTMLRRQETHIRALRQENSRLKHESRIHAYDDTQLALALQLSAAECRGQLNPDLMSYEQLLELGEQIGAVSVGLSSKQFAGLEEEVSEATQSTCSICQTDIEVGHKFKRLPLCPHLHHTDCIRQWFEHKNACPVCKVSAITRPQL